ncbi:hypothetical protein POPTR_001G169351v4 [Populus trichocarpa]|uniref:Uncharacterized protein n=1 Tax=Populus trichocarpa TaxID=3694 RepID=A0ACC0TKP7_POPTR|nr:hypothetical protein POPTR_001G169351v4 [Populus trichocarpa]
MDQVKEKIQVNFGFVKKRKREQRRILAQGCNKRSHGLGVLEQEVEKCRRLFYELQASWEKKSLLLYSVIGERY